MEDDTQKQSKIETDSQPEFPDQKLSKRKIALSRIKRRLLKHLWLVRAGLIIGTFFTVYLFLALTGSIVKRSEYQYDTRFY